MLWTALLSFGHALLCFTLSHAPGAADVREALIRTFTKVTPGELSTAPRIELRVLEVAAQRIVAPTLSEQREFHSAVLTRMEQTDRRVITIENKLLGIERASLRFMDKPFTPRTRRLHQLHVWSQYAGMCPCCRIVQIVKENGERLPACNDEHHSGRAKNKLHQTWTICAECIQRLVDLDYHGAMHQVFVNYQDSPRHFLSVELKKQSILFDPMNPTPTPVLARHIELWPVDQLRPYGLHGLAELLCYLPQHDRRRNRLAPLFPHEGDQPTRGRPGTEVTVQHNRSRHSTSKVTCPSKSSGILAMSRFYARTGIAFLAS